MTQAQLPPELIESVIKLSIWPSSKVDRKDEAAEQLVTCSLVNREWRSIAQPLLYRSPSLGIIREEADAFLATLKGSPALALEVETLDISEGIEDQTEGDVVLEIVRLCPNLLELELGCTLIDVYLLLSFAPQLRFLHLGECHLLSKSTARSQEPSRLQMLVIKDDCQYSADPALSKQPFLPNLRFLSIANGPFDGFPFLDSLPLVEHLDWASVSTYHLSKPAIAAFTACCKVKNLRAHIDDLAEVGEGPPIVELLKNCRIASLCIGSVGSASDVAEVLKQHFLSLSNLSMLSFSPDPFLEGNSVKVQEIVAAVKAICGQAIVNFGGICGNHCEDFRKEVHPERSSCQ